MGTLKLIIAFLLIGSTLFAQNGSITIKIPNTGSSGGGSVSSGAYYNVKNYGGVANGVTNCTSAIQLAINAAHASGGGIVYLPTESAGVYMTNKLTSYIDVTFQGDGYRGDTLRSIGADTLVVVKANDASNNTADKDLFSNTLIKDITIDGNSTGTIGFYTNGVMNFRFERGSFIRFTQVAMLLRSTLIGTINNCFFQYSPTAIKAYAGGGNLNAPNLVSIRDCVIWNSTKWGIDWSGGGGLHVYNINIEQCGTGGDTASGCINYHDNLWSTGLHIWGGWTERNLGTIINIQNNIANTFNSVYPSVNVNGIDGMLDYGHFNTNFTKRNIYIAGANQRLGISNSFITGGQNAIIADGVNNVVRSDANTIYNATNILRAGATFSTY